MRPKTIKQPVASTLEADTLALCNALDSLRRAHESLSTAMTTRQNAIRTADMRSLAAALREEGTIARSIGEIDRERAGVSARLAQTLSTAAEKAAKSKKNRAKSVEPTAPWIAARLPASLGSQVQESATALRGAIERVQAQNRADRPTVETLAGHMKGLLSTVRQKLSHSGVYSNRGAVEAGPSIVSSLDMTS